jgi:hypothetical protein
VPEELEALNGFPCGLTSHLGVSDATRAMRMGNALVVPLVRRIGEALHKAHVRNCVSAGEANNRLLQQAEASTVSKRERSQSSTRPGNRVVVGLNADGSCAFGRDLHRASTCQQAKNVFYMVKTEQLKAQL